VIWDSLCIVVMHKYAVLVEDEVLGVKSSDFGEGVNGWLEGVRDVMKSITIEITSLYWRFLFFFSSYPALLFCTNALSTRHNIDTPQ